MSNIDYDQIINDYADGAAALQNEINALRAEIERLRAELSPGRG